MFLLLSYSDEFIATLELNHGGTQTGACQALGCLGARAGKRGRGKLAPRQQDRGLNAAEVAIALDSPDIVALATLIREAGGAPIGAYRDPLGGRALLLASLPLKAIQPTPFQRDLSPTHVKRLASKIDETGAFLDPLIVVRGEGGQLWTPNGRHRLAAAKVLGLRQVTALMSPDETLAYRILALNTEKAHNLRDRSLEVIRMARSLGKRQPTRARGTVCRGIRIRGAADAGNCI